MSEETGKKIGDYQVLNEIGSGGMGRVYRVRNVITDRIEAMKVLLPDLAGRQELAARFQREIKVLASLNHPNIAQLRTALVVDNQLLMIMEYVEGTTLADRLDKGPVPVAEAVSYIDQVLNALSYAHQQHIIHRDIKPVKMMLTPQGVIKLMDFGIARSGEERSLTMTGTTLGSLNYMSPEQVKGESTDARSDLYSVGISLYELATGRKPFQAESDYSIMTAHVKDMPKAPIDLEPGLPSTLNEIILIAIAKDPTQRFQTADAFRNALSSVHGGATVTAVPAAKVDPDATAPMAVQTAVPSPAPVPTPPVATASIPPVPMPPPQPAGHRGLYMTLGALVVLVVLVAAGLYMPRSSKTQAKNSEQVSPGGESATQPQDLSTGSSQPSASPEATASNPAPVTASSATPSSTPQASSAGSLQDQVPLAAARSVESKPVSPKLAAKNHGAAKATNLQTEMQETDPQSALAAPDNKAELDELEHDIDLLSNRAAAVNSSLDRLQQEQSASGYGLRGDMVAKQSSMKNNLAKAQDAIERGDVERAKKFSTMAQGDVEALERFLGK
jgi:serine/threonine-protein kinase